jgi:uncharacterized protein with von Willebrand factor type A (vWA) domain
MANNEQNILAQLDPRLRKANRLSGLSGSSMQQSDNIYGETELNGSGAGRQNSISKADFRFLNDKKAMRQVEGLAEQLAEKLKHRLLRRRTIRPKGSRLDLRRTLRKNISVGGFPLRRCFSARIKEQPHLIILHDISHSMAWNNPLLFRFCRGLVRNFKKSAAFAFHTRLFPVTEIYRSHSLNRMREKLEANNHLWMGGTCIAQSIAFFNATFHQHCIAGKSIVVIISDGFDTDEPQQLQQELLQLKSRCKKIIWLNPMLGRQGVSTNAESLKQEHPSVDGFFPAHSLEALRTVMNAIASITH